MLRPRLRLTEVWVPVAAIGFSKYRVLAHHSKAGSSVTLLHYSRLVPALAKCRGPMDRDKHLHQRLLQGQERWLLLPRGSNSKNFSTLNRR